MGGWESERVRRKDRMERGLYGGGKEKREFIVGGEPGSVDGSKGMSMVLAGGGVWVGGRGSRRAIDQLWVMAKIDKEGDERGRGGWGGFWVFL
jgi:hypothetical protein